MKKLKVPKFNETDLKGLKRNQKDIFYGIAIFFNRDY